MAYVERDLGRAEEALAHAAKATAILEKLCEEAPDELPYWKQLGQAATIEGAIHDDALRNNLALKPFEEALEIQKRIEPGLGDDPEHKVDICFSLSNLGETYADMGRPGPAIPYFREALDRWIALLAARPDVPRYAANLAGLAIAMGDIQRHQADPVAATETFARASRRWTASRAPGRPTGR
jgi:tetratricopeptide (TPR) repeat protein